MSRLLPKIYVIGGNYQIAQQIAARLVDLGINRHQVRMLTVQGIARSYSLRGVHLQPYDIVIGLSWELASPADTVKVLQEVAVLEAGRNIPRVIPSFTWPKIDLGITSASP